MPLSVRSRSARVVLLCLVGAPAVADDVPPPGASSCAVCHAACGPVPAAPPCLRNWTPDQIAEALDAYRTGRRTGTVMPYLAKGFSREEIRALAEHLGQAAPR
ncbi:cytochrome c553 [Methylobacterium sp. BE186]|nr:cytochrome c553 [Methylobacterium sp. BE186]